MKLFWLIPTALALLCAYIFATFAAYHLVSSQDLPAWKFRSRRWGAFWLVVVALCAALALSSFQKTGLMPW